MADFQVRGITSAVPNPTGRLPNSFHQSESYSAGLSWLPRDMPLWAAFSFSSTGILHGMALVEDNGSIEIGPQPFDDLLDAGNLLAPVIGAQRGIGGKQDAFR